MFEMILQTFWDSGKVSESLYTYRACKENAGVVYCGGAPIVPVITNTLFGCIALRPIHTAALNHTLKVMGPDYPVKSFKLVCRRQELLS